MIDKNILNIKSIEEKYRVKLSKEYKEFINSNPMGYIVEEPNFIEFKVDFLDTSLVVLDRIYGFEELIEINSEFLSDISDFINCILIGEEDGGNFFLIESVSGRILYWDRTNLHIALSSTNRIPTPEVDLSISREEMIYYIFSNFNELELLIKN